MDEVVYTSQNRLRKTGTLIHEMINDLKRSRSIAYGIMVRNIRAQYRQLFLGRLWALVPGLAAAFLVVKVTSAGVLHVGKTDIPYPAFVVCGLLLWQTFVEALQGPIQGISTDRGLIRVQNIPAESVIMAHQGEVLINFAVKFVFMIVFLICYGVKIQWTTIFVPAALFSLILFGTAIGTALAPFNLLYQDVSRAIGFLTVVWMFVTPVIYPRPIKGPLSVLVALNPVTPLIITIRELVASSHLTHLSEFLWISVVSVVASVLAWVVFRVTFPFAIERLNH